MVIPPETGTEEKRHRYSELPKDVTSHVQPKHSEVSVKLALSQTTTAPLWLIK